MFLLSDNCATALLDAMRSTGASERRVSHYRRLYAELLHLHHQVFHCLVSPIELSLRLLLCL
jgi:hypothetical protein